MKLLRKIFIFTLFVVFIPFAKADEFTIWADTVRSDLKKFWNGTGFTPAKLMENDQMRQQIIYWAAVPHKGLVYVRAHYMLDLVDGRDWFGKSPVYEWSRLDKVIDLLVENDLKPFFELMGVPGGEDEFDVRGFDDKDEEKWLAWESFIRALTAHLIDRYGLEEVKSWYFETWNEPDLVWVDRRNFNRYYLACRRGIKKVNSELLFGGPGNAFTLANIYKLLLEYTDYDHENNLPGPGIDFISVHEKGGSGSVTDWPSSNMILENSKAGYIHLLNNHSGYSKKPFINNEADPISGWKKELKWRTGPYYAAFIAKVINMLQVDLVEKMGVDYRLHHNDNGFLGNWYRRTLLALIEGKGDNDGFALIKQPSLSIMTLMSLLGDKVLESRNRNRIDSNVNIMATSNGDDYIAVMVYNSVDDYRTEGRTRVPLRFENLPFEKAALIGYSIDQDNTNPYRAWTEMSSPDNPTAKQLEELRYEQELKVFIAPKNVDAEEGSFSIDIEQKLPGVSLIVLADKPEAFSPTIEQLKKYTFKGLNGREILLRWKPVDSKFLKTYIVEYSKDNEDYKRINKADLLDSAFISALKLGYYRVKAVDYWDRVSPFSDVIRVVDE
jgi:L-iduronidase